MNYIICSLAAFQNKTLILHTRYALVLYEILTKFLIILFKGSKTAITPNGLILSLFDIHIDQSDLYSPTSALAFSTVRVDTQLNVTPIETDVTCSIESVSYKEKRNF